MAISTSIDSTKQFQNRYPYVGIDRDRSNIVFFTNKSTGFVLDKLSSEGYSIGAHRTDWVEGVFNPATITIRSNV